jgi:hypothetical protein
MAQLHEYALPLGKFFGSAKRLSIRAQVKRLSLG